MKAQTSLIPVWHYGDVVGVLRNNDIERGKVISTSSYYKDYYWINLEGHEECIKAHATDICWWDVMEMGK